MRTPEYLDHDLEKLTDRGHRALLGNRRRSASEMLIAHGDRGKRALGGRAWGACRRVPTGGVGPDADRSVVGADAHPESRQVLAGVLQPEDVRLVPQEEPGYVEPVPFEVLGLVDDQDVEGPIFHGVSADGPVLRLA